MTKDEYDPRPLFAVAALTYLSVSANFSSLCLSSD
jgi:hypothetical protein